MNDTNTELPPITGTFEITLPEDTMQPQPETPVEQVEAEQPAAA